MSDKRIVSQDRGEAVSLSKRFNLSEIAIKSLNYYKQIAREHGIRFMETSAKANVNIERAFCELAEAILDKTSGQNTTENAERVIVDQRGQDRQPAYKGCCA